nr:putative nuclease HARBI1 [Tanacetum cinerariifolium]
MNFDQIFFDDTDEEEEVNSLVFEFFKNAATLLQASTSTTPKILRNPIARDRHGAHDCLVAPYLTEQPTYTPKQFRKQLRMRRNLFTRIVRELSDRYSYFQLTHDVAERCGISALMKCTSAIRQLSYDAVLDSLDEYLQIGIRRALLMLETLSRRFFLKLNLSDHSSIASAAMLVAAQCVKVIEAMGTD